MARLAIVGAGPAGAALAYLLARRGIDVTLLKVRADFVTEPRSGSIAIPRPSTSRMGQAADAPVHGRQPRRPTLRRARPLRPSDPGYLRCRSAHNKPVHAPVSRISPKNR